MPTGNFNFSVKEEYGRFPPVIERFIAFVIVGSVALYIVEVEYAGTDNSRQGHHLWLWIERIVASIFTIEYVLRARQIGTSYLKSRAGFIDLIAFLPFWIGFFVPAVWLGLIRSMRVLRLLKLYRYSKAMRVFLQALIGSKKYLGGMLLIVFIIMLFGAVGIHEIEKEAQPDFNSLANCIWWTVVTLMTVGYGDMYPVTPLGKVFAEFLMVIGVGLTASFIGIVGSNVYHNVQKLEKED
ncbi:ion transporter [bacterium]|nr:ion transporter [bacterium]